MKKIHKARKIAALLLALAVTFTAVPQTAGVAYAAIANNVNTVRANSPKLSDTKIRLNVGKKYRLTYTGMSGTVKWISSNKSVATVNSKGLVKARKPQFRTLFKTVT